MPHVRPSHLPTSGAPFSSPATRRVASLLPNPWDVGSARAICKTIGFQRPLATTTSSGFAWSHGTPRTGGNVLGIGCWIISPDMVEGHGPADQRRLSSTVFAPDAAGVAAEERAPCRGKPALPDCPSKTRPAMPPIRCFDADNRGRAHTRPRARQSTRPAATPC